MHSLKLSINYVKCLVQFSTTGWAYNTAVTCIHSSHTTSLEKYLFALTLLFRTCVAKPNKLLTIQ